MIAPHLTIPIRDLLSGVELCQLRLQSELAVPMGSVSVMYTLLYIYERMCVCVCVCVCTCVRVKVWSCFVFAVDVLHGINSILLGERKRAYYCLLNCQIFAIFIYRFI